MKEDCFDTLRVKKVSVNNQWVHPGALRHTNLIARLIFFIGF